MTPALTLNLGMRWAYTQPVVEKDNRQGNFDLTTGPGDPRRRTAAARAARSTRPTRKASSRGSASPGGRARAGSCAAPTASRSTWKARAPTCGCRSTRRSSSSRRSTTTRRPGPGTLATGFAELKPLDQPSGQVRAWDPNLRPQFTQQWNVFVEYLLTPSMSANVGYVGHNATHLVTPVEGNQPLPGVGDPSTWAPLADAPSAVSRPRRSSPTSRRRRRAAAATTTALQVEPPAAQRQGRRVPGVVHAEPDAHQQPRLLRLGRRRRPRARTG